MSTINGIGNTISPDSSINGIPYKTWLSITRRINTELGARALYPKYGIRLRGYIGQDNALPGIRLAVQRALTGATGTAGPPLVTQPRGLDQDTGSDLCHCGRGRRNLQLNL